MRIYYMSDIHLEFYPVSNNPKIVFPVSDYIKINFPEDAQTSTLALCGDIGMVDSPKRREQYQKFISRLADEFKHVIVIRGNHESYSYSFDKTPNKIRELINDTGIWYNSNIHFLDNEFLELEGKLIYGSPFFTDFSGDYLTEWNVSKSYNDFKRVRNNQHKRKLSTQDYIDFYKASVEHCKTRYPDIVLSHYLPSLSLLEYSTGTLDGGMGGEALRDVTSDGNNPPSVWIYGHDHSRKETMLGNTLCVSNCWGYYGNEHFKKEMTFDKFVDV
jgi:DNA repair exonuclease SbcCD nuclease subunit